MQNMSRTPANQRPDTGSTGQIREADFVLPGDSADDLPLTTVLQALSRRSGGSISLEQRRDGLEQAIRRHWADLTRLVVEYDRLSTQLGDSGAVPSITRFTLPPLSQRPRRAHA